MMDDGYCERRGGWEDSPAKGFKDSNDDTLFTEGDKYRKKVC
jgi:hypothetical protein